MSVPLWRVTRSRPARELYDALTEVGVTATQLYQYERSLDASVDPNPPGAVDLDCRRLEAPTTVAGDRLEAGDLLVTATERGRPVGRVFVSLDRRVRVAPLEATVHTSGAYVWRLYVRPSCRGRGIATALVARAIEAARERGARRAVALVAPDNRPSQWVFESCGFDRGRRHGYYRLFEWSRRTTTSPLEL
jgi:GNAT superfamily N-acetyltransferase